MSCNGIPYDPALVEENKGLLVYSPRTTASLGVPGLSQQKFRTESLRRVEEPRMDQNTDRR